VDTAQIVWGMLFGAIGAGYMVYGRRQRAIVPLVCGLALVVFPYFVSASWALVLIGAVLMAIPYFVRL
jgi:CHASE2 domain-containing sensor protein